MNTNNNAEDTAKNQMAIAPKKLTPSERFTAAVAAEFSANVLAVNLTNFQKKLSMNYFIKLDQTLKDSEKKRMAKQEQYREALAYTWENVNMQKLAVDVVCWSAIGLDPLQPNHINILPYKNNSSNKYDIGFLPGYKGAEIKARKYGLDVPDHVVVELVYANDEFKQIKRDQHNQYDTYLFKVIDDFNRGEIVGGFYYHQYDENPTKNKIRVFTKADIMKRKPDTASVEFWGGEKDEWRNGQKTGEKIHVEGWFEEMAYKTIYKAAYNVITIDSSKIDDAYVEVIKREAENNENKVALEVAAHANMEQLNFVEAEIVPEEQTPREEEAATPVAAEENEAAAEVPAEQIGPGF